MKTRLFSGKKIKCRCGKAGICIFCRIKITFHVPVLTNGQKSVLYNVPLQESVQEQGMEGCAMKKQSILKIILTADIESKTWSSSNLFSVLISII